MAAATEGKYAGEFIVDDEGELSRDAVTVLSGQTLPAGRVCGVVDRGIGGIVAVLSGTSPGDGTMTDIYAGQDVEVGAYLVQCTAIASHGGVFSVTSPSGKVLPSVTMAGGSGAATTYRSSHINFTLTDGSTDFAVTALFTVTVSTTAPTVIGGTGTGTISSLALGPEAKFGRYMVINRAAVSNGGDFEIIDPDGNSIGRFLMGTGSTQSATFSNPHISFVLTDATDFILNNRFDIAVFHLLTAKAAEWDPRPTAFDGRQIVAGIAFDNYDASGGDVKGVLEVRRAQVNGAELTFKSTVSVAEQAVGKAALTAMGVVVR